MASRKDGFYRVEEMTIYSCPEKYGLEIVATVREEDSSYDYDIFVVWKDKEGQLYYAHDSGCSCPVPFEDFENKDALTRLYPYDINKFLGELSNWNHKSVGTNPPKSIPSK